MAASFQKVFDGDDNPLGVGLRGVGVGAIGYRGDGDDSKRPSNRIEVGLNGLSQAIIATMAFFYLSDWVNHLAAESRNLHSSPPFFFVEAATGINRLATTVLVESWLPNW